MISVYHSLLKLYYQIAESLSGGGLSNLVKKRIYFKRLAVPVEMILSNSPSYNENEASEFHFLELKSDDLNSRKRIYTYPSRYFKAPGNLKKGWRDFIIIKDSTVVGDVWCTTPNRPGDIVVHPDLELLGITANNSEAYAFDMFIDPVYRGKNLAILLHRYLHTILKAEGYKKVYGFFWNDNIPALWMHRMLRFTELPKRLLSRFFFFQSSQLFRQN